MHKKWNPTHTANDTNDGIDIAPEADRKPLFSHTADATKKTKRFIRRPTANVLKRTLYGLAAVMALVWLGIGLNAFWGAQTSKLRSQNSGRAITAVGEVRNLEAPITVGYGKTSSSLPAVTTSYENAIKTLNSLYPEQSWPGNSYPSHMASINATNEKVRKDLDTLKITLQNSQGALDTTARFLQYDPATDLQPYASGAEPDATERLSRTEQGLQDVVKALQASKVPYKAALADQIRPLLGKAESLQPKDVQNWAREVSVAQKRLLALIEANTTPRLETNSAQLEIVSRQYLPTN